MSQAIVLVRHMREANFCMKGVRAWFAARDWCWASFVAEGRSAQDFLDTGDPLARVPAEIAIREAEDGR